MFNFVWGQTSLTRLGRTLAVFVALQRPLLLRKLFSIPPRSVRRAPPRPRPLTYNRLLLGGVLSFLWGDRDKEDAVPPYIKHQLLKAQRWLREGEYGQASAAYHRALRRLATSQHAESQPYIEARAVVLDKLANMYLEQGLLDKAEVAFKDAMKFMLAAGMEQESEAIVEISLKLSKIYTNQKRYELADVGFEWCVETAEKLCTDPREENNVALCGMCYHCKGQYHTSRAQWDKASHCFSQALALSQEVFNSNHLQVAVLHNDLATALDGGGLYGDAETHARTALKIVSDSSATEALEYRVRVYYNLGMILSHQGKVVEARDVLTKALDGAAQIKDRPLQRHIEYILQEEIV